MPHTMEASRDVHFHRAGLDRLTDDILTRSSATLEKIEENIRLTHSLRMSTSLIAQMDTRIDRLSHNLHQYQHFLTQLNTLLMRAEFFESQLNMLEAEQQVNAMRTRRGLPSLHNWKDEDLNWRTTAATLDNLWMEYRFLSRKIQDLSNQDQRYSQAPLNSSSFIYEDKISTPLPTTPQQTLNSPFPSRLLQEKFDTNIRLKPIRCSSKSSDTTSRRTSLNLSLNLLTKSFVTTPKHAHDVLPTPDTTIDNSLLSQSSSVHDFKVSLPLPSNDMVSPLSTRTRNATHRHTRCKSSPLGLRDLMLIGATSDTTALPIPNPKFNLRHFISHDTGLKTKFSPLKSEKFDSEEEGVKDSEFIHSPASLKLEEFIMKSITERKEEHQEKSKKSQDEKNKNTNDHSLPDDESVLYTGSQIPALQSPISLSVSTHATVIPSIVSPVVASIVEQAPEATHVDDYRTELPTFEHRLNRSNSCDSIFSAMTSRIPVQPGKDSRAQTLLWMQKFSKPQAPSVENTSAVSTVSANNLTISSRGPSNSRQALSSLVSQARRPEQVAPTTSNTFSSWFSSKKTTETPDPSLKSISQTPVQTQEPSSEDSSFGASFMSSFLKPKATKNPRLSSVSEEPSKTDNSTKCQSFAAGHPAERQSNGWPRFVNSLTPQSMMKSQDLVTSEVGKRSMPVPTKGSWNVASREHIKGSFSTLTIGPHGSKIVQHGESSSYGQSSVVTSRVSHAALQDALANDILLN